MYRRYPLGAPQAWQSQTKRSFGLIEVIVKVACDPSLFKAPVANAIGAFLVLENLKNNATPE